MTNIHNTICLRSTDSLSCFTRKDASSTKPRIPRTLISAFWGANTSNGAGRSATTLLSVSKTPSHTPSSCSITLFHNVFWLSLGGRLRTVTTSGVCFSGGCCTSAWWTNVTSSNGEQWTRRFSSSLAELSRPEMKAVQCCSWIMKSIMTPFAVSNSLPEIPWTPSSLSVSV